MTDLSGNSIGRYHIIEQLGRGGMATVYKAFDTRLEREVAIKLIRREAFPAEMHERLLKRFEREAKSLARLDHASIVKVFDYGEYQGAPYLVLQYVPGGTLKNLTGKPIPWQEAAGKLLPIARALAYAHQRGVLHRDIKPANLLLSETGEPMLSDFGIAKMLESEEAATLTGTGVGIGTPEYMAPEQGLGEEVDDRTDVYALGVVFYELVTGSRPFQADTPLAVLYKQMNDPLPRPGNFITDLPEKVEAVLYKALAKQREDRYTTMDQFAAALAGLAQGGQEQVAAGDVETRVLEEQQPAAETLAQVTQVSSSGQDSIETVARQPESQETPAEAESQPRMDTASTRVASASGDASPKPAKKGKLPVWAWALLGLAGLGIVAIVIVAALGGLGSGQTPTEAAVMPVTHTATQKPAPTEAQAAPAAAEPASISVILITPNPLGDRSFIDAAARGIEKFRLDYPDVQADILETNGVSEHEAALRGAIAKGYDMIIGLAMDQQLMFDLAAEFPHQKFGSASEIYAEELPENMAGYVINVHESSFLVGVVVGMLTETKTVGAVVGGDAPGLNQFFYGYKQGVLEVCPDCTVLVSYLGFDFSNPTLGLESALAQYDQGVDIVYQVAGRSGEGVLSAAAERGLYAIGVDSNQDDTHPGHVIVSSIKATDTTTYLLAEMALKGFSSGFHQLGLSDGGAGLSWDYGSTTFEENGPQSMVAKLPAVRLTVEEYRTKILSGEYKVCNALDEDPALCDPLK